LLPQSMKVENGETKVIQVNAPNGRARDDVPVVFEAKQGVRSGCNPALVGSSPTRLSIQEKIVEKFQLEHSEVYLVGVHSHELCRGEPCTLHNRTDHHMRSFPQHWRSDRKIMERICPHGVGHPDPDERKDIDTIHGCDGCCNPQPVLDFVGNEI